MKMKLNENIEVEGHRVYLVPYEKHHVLKYHEWMKSQDLQILTASEPLTLEEEYDMQKSWREDADKCTFIVLCKDRYDETKDEVEAMIGDTNIFLKSENEHDFAEIEVMIAEKSARGRGLGKEAVLLMIQYGIENLNIKTFRAIILKSNVISISLFKSIGFEKIGENKVFDEVIFEKRVSDIWIKWIKSNIKFHQKVRPKQEALTNCIICKISKFLEK